MRDMIPSGDGNSRFLKSVSNFKSLYPTYEDFVEALISGTLPVDFNGINASGIIQIGTPLNTNSLLKDETAEAFGLDSSAVPDDALNAIKQITDQKAEAQTHVVEIPTGWTSGTDFTKTVSVNGILATDNPIADIVLGDDVDANAAYLMAWGAVTRVTTADGSITLHAKAEPSTAFTVQLKVVR